MGIRTCLWPSDACVVADHESYLVASLSSFPSYLQENFRCTARVIHIHDPPDELEEKGEGDLRPLNLCLPTLDRLLIQNPADNEKENNRQKQ